MKKLLCMCLVLMISAMSVCTVTFAKENGVKVIVDGQTLDFDVEPVVVSDRLLVPFRSIFEALDCDVSYYQDGEKLAVDANKGLNYMTTVVGSDEIKINDKNIKMDVSSKIVNDRTLVPLRAVSEALGANVEWSKDTNTVTITRKQGNHKILPKKYSDNLYDDDGTKLISFKYSYPVIENSSSSEYINQINDSYKLMAEKYVKNIKETFEKDAKDLHSQIKEEFNPFEFSLTYDVQYDKNNYLSITTYDYNYTGGAHPNSDFEAKTYDLSNNKELKLNDIIKGTDDEINNLVCSKFTDYFKQNVEGTDEEILKAIKAEAGNVCFYITDDGLSLYFKVYQVAYYAVGYPGVNINYDENKELFKILI